jgi:hypothetical protein
MFLKTLKNICRKNSAGFSRNTDAIHFYLALCVENNPPIIDFHFCIQAGLSDVGLFFGVFDYILY